MKAPLSAVLITRNAASVLEPCLESLAFVDDIVIVDSASTDATGEIAARHGARLVKNVETVPNRVHALPLGDVRGGGRWRFGGDRVVGPGLN